MSIETEGILKDIHDLGDDTRHSREESYEFYCEIASDAQTAATALREELKAEGVEVE